MATWLSLQRTRLHLASSDEQQHEQAFGNFMRVMARESLPIDIRLLAASALAQYAEAGMLSLEHQERLTGYFHWTMLDQIPDTEPNRMAMSQALAMAVNLHGSQARRTFHSLDDDLALQRRPLSQQVNEWLGMAALPYLDATVSFDDEPNSSSFARLLARRQPDATTSDAEALLKAGGEVISAIAMDANLRANVFAMAENALGTCHDNVTEGFSAIVTVVRNHRMAEAVRQGTIGMAELSQWARGQFRLHALEQEVHRFISQASAKNEEALEKNTKAMNWLRGYLQNHTIMPVSSLANALTHPITLKEELDEAVAAASLLDPHWPVLLKGGHMAAVRHDLQSARHLLVAEPLETMLHAKVKLREALELPQDTSSALAYEGSSVLTANDLKGIEAAVRLRESDGLSLQEFLLSNETWRAGMKQLHRAEFQALNDEFDEDPFYEQDLPLDGGDENVAEQMAYVAAAKSLEQRKAQAEVALLLKCAGLE